MTEQMHLYKWLNRLVIPEQDLAKLSFCQSNKEAQVRAWREQLPLMQSHQACSLLYKAIPEITRLKTTPDVRLAMLEDLRSQTFQSLQVLAQSYLNQPLILPETALKAATLAQAIQKHINNAYLVVVRDLCTQTKKNIQPQQALALHRAITGLGHQLLRNYQLYIPIAGQIWSEIHALYQIACELQLHHLHVDDPLPHHHGCKNISEAYLRVLLLACARPNQLRQEEVIQCYNLLELLAPNAELIRFDPNGKENLYVIMADSNRPPIYKSRLESSAAKERRENLMELRTSVLLNKLQELQNNSQSDHQERVGNPFTLSTSLHNHLIQAWSHLSLRSFNRTDVNADIEVTVGLSNIHFHLANEQSFSVFLKQGTSLSGTDSIFQKRGALLKNTAASTEDEDDPWGDAFDISGTIFDGSPRSTSNIDKALLENEANKYSGQHSIYKIPLIDRSPGGFGLEWRGDIPAQLKAGELVGLREYGRGKWSIGVVRWVHQIKGATQLGIQVLAPHAIPVGLAVIHKTGGMSEYLRGLLIPEVKAIHQPNSLIANAISFHEYTKVKLYSQDQAYEDKFNLQLLERKFATGSFSQFTYRELSSGKTAESSSANKDDFDSVWE